MLKNRLFSNPFSFYSFIHSFIHIDNENVGGRQHNSNRNDGEQQMWATNIVHSI